MDNKQLLPLELGHTGFSYDIKPDILARCVNCGYTDRYGYFYGQNSDMYSSLAGCPKCKSMAIEEIKEKKE